LADKPRLFLFDILFHLYESHCNKNEIKQCCYNTV